MKHFFRFDINGKLLLFITLCLFFSIPRAHANLPYCDTVFSNAVQTFGPGSYVHFDYNAQLVNPSSLALNTGSVLNHVWSIRKSCATDQCSATGTELPRLYDDRELQTGSTLEVVIPRSKKITVGAGDAYHFGRVAISEWGTAVFSERHDVYVIDRLHVGYKSSLRLPAGEYWVRDLRLEVESRIDVLGDGKVSLYVIDSLLVPFNVKLNANTKNPAQMTIYTYSASEFYVGSQTYAFLRADNEVFLHHRARITGGVLAQFVDMRTESQIVYDAAAARTLEFNNICRAAGDYPSDDVTPPEILDVYLSGEIVGNRAGFAAVVRDVGDNASGVASVVLRSATEEFPMQADGDNYTVENIPLVVGDNFFTLVARDHAGNEATADTGTPFDSPPTFVNISYPEASQEPIVLITGEVHTYWPLEDLTFLVAGEPEELIPVSEGVYHFAVNYQLSGWLNRFNIYIGSPDEDEEFRLDIIYHPAAFYVTVDQNDLETDAETITLTGFFGIPGEGFNENIQRIYVVGEHFPGEITAVIEPDSADRGRFSAVVPLVPGPNYFSVRVRSTPGQFPWEQGATIIRTP